jgi:Flp pilus assembly protein TadD
MELYDLFEQGRRHLAAGEIGQAIVPLEQARNISPSTGSIREALAVAYLRARRYEDALPEAEAAVECAPNDHYAYFLLGRAHQGLGDLVAARAQYRHATWLRPGDHAYESALASVGPDR